MVARPHPRLIEGGVAVDDRGQVAFVNDFDFGGVKRFYVVSNHQSRFLRAWHAHKREEKFATVLSGAALFGVVPVDDWQEPSRDLPISRFVLTEHKPAVLHIPAGFAHGFMTLRPDTRVVFFSSATLAESAEDDFRYDARYWDFWTVVER